MAYDSEIAQKTTPERRLEVFGVMEAIAQEHDRAREFIDLLASDLDPYLIPTSEKPEGRSIGQDSADPISQIVSHLRALHAQSEAIAEALVLLRRRVK